MQCAQFRPGFDALLFAEPPSGVQVDGERLVLPSGAVERQHQGGDDPLGVRVLRGELAQLADEVRVPAQLQLEADPFLPHPTVVLDQPGTGRRRPGAG